MQGNEESNLKSNPKFYVCTYGGSGSKMLSRYLSNFGQVHHLHARKPPTNLTNVGPMGRWYGPTFFEPMGVGYFSSTIIPNKDLEKYKVLFLYRDPIKAIYSRFDNPNHLRNIQCNRTDVTLEEVLKTKKDLYGIEDFFDNYTTSNNRNYQIYCIKYEDFFDNISTFNKILQLPDDKVLYPQKKETKKVYEKQDELESIYSSLLQKMKQMDFITIV